MPRKKNANTIADDINSFSQVNVTIQVPDGVVLETEEEKIIWEQFTATRSPDSWRDFDLVLLSKIVKLEVKIREYQKELDEKGPTVTNPRGNSMENPLFRIIDTLTRQQMAVIRAMSLNQTASAPRSLNKTGKKLADAKAVMDDLDEDLIPRFRAIQ